MNTFICTVIEVIHNDIDIPTVFFGENEDQVVKKAEEHFAKLLKENAGQLLDDKEFDELLEESLDNGYYDDDNGYRLIFNWPHRVEVSKNGTVKEDGKEDGE